MLTSTGSMNKSFGFTFINFPDLKTLMKLSPIWIGLLGTSDGDSGTITIKTLLILFVSTRAYVRLFMHIIAWSVTRFTTRSLALSFKLPPQI